MYYTFNSDYLRPIYIQNSYPTQKYSTLQIQNSLTYSIKHLFHLFYPFKGKEKEIRTNFDKPIDHHPIRNA